MQLHLAPAVTRRRRIPRAVGPLALINMNVSAGSLLALRQLVMRVCGDALQFIRVDAGSQTLRARVCLCVEQSVQAAALDAVRRAFPDTVITRLCATGLPHLARPAPA